ncbi:2-oxo acid dehydrogenase subunit E2 [Leifsonia shinshuensis]|uniref:2-oxo acid dehydrogenase subunit E2 n=1 Tax=Leifsonia shinshuensis TaxID=150026 RepID=UPI001F50B2CC|nr:2-oxo acid dehydrogenase subunit E2 [Leifsonia shinshuensis]MCI0158790.1 2-oxo acid dehydrogenase subunit E2 [Leifsonia shinshuensis]
MQEIYVPALGMASDTVYLAEWLKQPGDRIEAGDEIAQIETDKAEMSIEAPAAGTLGRHRFPDATEVPSGATIAVLLDEGESEVVDDSGSGERADDAPAAAPEATVPAAAPAVQDAVARPRDEAGPLRRSDRARLESGELEPYVASPHRRTDLLAERSATGATRTPAPIAAPSAAPSAAPGAAQPPAHTAAASVSPADPAPTGDRGADRHRAAVAAAVSRSWAEIPHFAVEREVRVERLDEVLAGYRTVHRHVTFTDLIVKAFGLALIETVGTSELDLGLAVATDRGVAIPVLRDVARRDVLGIADSRRAAIERSKAARLDPDDAVEPICTVSNLGAYGVDSFTGIVPIGQKGILTVGSASLRPVVENGELAVGRAMTVTLNVDHRHWDGQHAAEILSRFAAIAANPILLTSFGR